VRGELAIVGDETLDRRLDHRVAAVAQGQAGLRAELRHRPAQRLGALGQGAGGVEPGEVGGEPLERGQMRLQGIEQGFVELALAHQRALAGGECAVLEGLQLGRDVAFGVL